MLYSVFFSSFLWNGLIFGSKSRVKYKYHKASTVVIVVAVVVVLFTQVCWSVLYSRLYLLYWKRLYLVVVIKAVDCDATAHSSNNVSVSFFFILRKIVPHCFGSSSNIEISTPKIRIFKRTEIFMFANVFPLYQWVSSAVEKWRKKIFFQFMNDFDAFFVCRFAFGGIFS